MPIFSTNRRVGSARSFRPRPRGQKAAGRSRLRRLHFHYVRLALLGAALLFPAPIWMVYAACRNMHSPLALFFICAGGLVSRRYRLDYLLYRFPAAGLFVCGDRDPVLFVAEGRIKAAVMPLAPRGPGEG